MKRDALFQDLSREHKRLRDAIDRATEWEDIWEEDREARVFMEKLKQRYRRIGHIVQRIMRSWYNEA